MTDSFQSTAFESFARPVETFVAPPEIQPKTDASELADILKTINPNIQKYLAFGIEEEAKKEANKALNDALDDTTGDFQETTDFLKTNELIGGNIFYDRVYRRTKANVLGSTLDTKLLSAYSTTMINGLPLSSYAIDSPEYQNWLEEQKNDVINLLGDIDTDTFESKFFPFLVDATDKVNKHHIEEFQRYQVELIKGEASNLVTAIVQYNALELDNSEEALTQKELILQTIQTFENDINKLGLDTQTRSSINKIILDSLAAKAQEIGFETRDSELALKILSYASFFPYGQNGELTLSNHPDYLELKNDLLNSVLNFSYNQDQRDIAEANRVKDKELNDNLVLYADYISNGEFDAAKVLLDQIRRDNPTLAASITNNANAFTGTHKEQYAQLIAQIDSGELTLAEGRLAAIEWFSRGDTANDKVVADFKSLMNRVRDVDNGLLQILEVPLAELAQELPILIMADEELGFIVARYQREVKNIIDAELIGLTSELNKWRYENRDADGEQVLAEKERLRNIYVDKIKNRIKNLYSQYLDTDINNEIIENNEGFEGVPTDETNTNESTNTNNDLGFLLPDSPEAFFRNLESIDEETIKRNLNALTEELNRRNIDTTNIEPAFATPITEEDLEIERLRDFYDSKAESYTVKSGDNLSVIADQFNVTVEEIKDRNNLTTDIIQPNQVLEIPYNPVNNKFDFKSQEIISFKDFGGLAELIRSGESTNRYNVVNDGSTDTARIIENLENMTINEIIAMQEKGEVYAVGAYQFIDTTLKEALPMAGLTGDETFSKDIQDRLFWAVVVNSKYREDLTDYLFGLSNDIDSAVNDLALIFAAVKKSDGTGQYDGDAGRNTANIDYKLTKQALENARKQLLDK